MMGRMSSLLHYVDRPPLSYSCLSTPGLPDVVCVSPSQFKARSTSACPVPRWARL